MKLLVVSDIHYAEVGEQARREHEARAIGNPVLRWGAKAWRHWIWLRDPLAHNHRLGRLIRANPSPDLVVANGDFSLDSGFIGVSDAAAYASAESALNELRAAYGDRLFTTMGDHELGKKSLFGGAGGLRFGSGERSINGLGIPPVWRHEIGRHVLVGAASTPLALPVFLPETLPEEQAGWREVAEETFAGLESVFRDLRPNQRVVLFVHDPSALPFLARRPEIARRLGQVACTVVGHLHTPAVFRLGSWLAGFPAVNFCGHTIRRYSRALREARWWREFRTVLCPSPTGIELLKDGGWLDLEIPEYGDAPLEIQRRHLSW